MSISFEDALKAKKLRDYFSEHGRIYILVDATSEDVQVPDFLKGDHSLPLVLNARMPQAIHIRDTFLESNFSFSGVSHHCVIPMNRIWATYLPEADLSSGIVWDESMPEIVKMMMHAERKRLPTEVMEERANLEKVDDDEKTPPTPKENDAAGRKVRHLRVVK